VLRATAERALSSRGVTGLAAVYERRHTQAAQDK